jgi:hypothetical protein
MADCFNVMKDASAGRLSDDELRSTLKDLEREYEFRKASRGLGTLEDEMFRQGYSMIEQADYNRKIEKRNRYINIIKKSQLMRRIELADEATGDPSLGLESAIGGINTPFKGSSLSADSITGGLEAQYLGGLLADLESQGVAKQFRTMKADLEREVNRVIWDLNRKKPEGNATKSTVARKIGEVMHKYQRAALIRENKAGSAIRLRDGYSVKTMHDPGKMASYGRDQWKKIINDLLDYDLMGIREDRIDDFLNSAYRAITTGVRFEAVDNDIAKQIAATFKGPQNLAKKNSASSVFRFKDADSWYEYNQIFGSGSLRESYYQGLRHSAQSIGVMEVFGTNPESMLDLVRETAKRKYTDFPEKVARLDRKNSVIGIDAMMAEVTGTISIGAAEPIARGMAALRNLQTLSKLGGTFISALADPAFTASSRIYQGRSLMDAWGDAFMAPIKGMAKGEQKKFLQLTGVGFETATGELVSRFNPADDAPGRLSKLMQLFFKLNLLGPYTDASKRGVASMIMNDLGSLSDTAFDALDEPTQRMLNIYGIDAKGWDIARASTQKDSNGRPFIVSSGIKDDNVKERMFALIHSEVNNSVITPGARERAIMRRGYKPNTTAGEAIRFFMQFKAFGVTVLSKTVGRHMYGYGAKNMRDALVNGKAGYLGLASAFVGSTLMGYFVLQGKELLAGRNMRENSPELFLAAALQGGGVGIYGDFLFGEANRYGGGPAGTFLGPAASTVFDTIDLTWQLRDIVLTGEGDARGDAIRLLKSNTPFGNLFYTKQAMDYMIWYQAQEMINPGYLRRMERRVKRENDQTFWLPPTSVVQTGGGFR